MALYPTFKTPSYSWLKAQKIPAWNPASNPNFYNRIATSAAALPALPTPFSTGDPAGGTPPPGYGDILSTLLSGLGGAGGGVTPEEGIASAKRALIQYGLVPGDVKGLTNLAPAFGKDVQKLAAANTASGISVLARINQAHADMNRYIPNRLAAHGILGSGETGFQLGREQTDYARSQADSTGKLLDYLHGINAGIAQYLQWQALMNALQNAGSGGDSGGGGGEVPNAGAAPAPPWNLDWAPGGGVTIPGAPPGRRIAF